ncbi:MAG TPA: PDZ domain-containing protein, partial [Vicinamibacterales bacterium]|nr:PDZ domain-containing protein [Vicinamibacterales bacterium]
MSSAAPSRRAWFRPTAQTAVVIGLLCLAIANIVQRASWSEQEDGVLWRTSGGDVTAVEIAPGTAADHAGIHRGDVLLAIDGTPVVRAAQVVDALHETHAGQALKYTILRMRSEQMFDVAVAPIPSSPRGLYFMLAAVGVFSLLVGASVRLRRPDHQATLHFFWLTVAFFGTLAFSFTGKLDTLDWVFYWGDLTAQLLLPPLFLHF